MTTSADSTTSTAAIIGDHHHHHQAQASDEWIVEWATLQQDDESENDNFVRRLTHLINAAYRKGEQGILVDTKEEPFYRMTEPDVKDLIRQQKLLVLTSSSSSSKTNATNRRRLLGCIKLERVQDEEEEGGGGCVEWGCLAVQLDAQGQGHGRRLVEAAERIIRDEWHGQWAQLELLAPTHWKHDHKERLREWYTARLGYHPLHEEVPPCTTRLAQGTLLGGRFRLATDADFTVYRKRLLR